MDGDADNRPTGWERREESPQLPILGVLRLKGLSSAVEPQDLRRTLESAQHDDNASVLSHMRDCLGAASHVVQVRDGLGADHPKSIQALWRHIDVPRFVKWRRAYKKHVLC